MSTISKNIQQIAIKTSYRTSNSWNISSSSFDGPNTYSYSRSIFYDGYDTVISPSGNAVYSTGGTRTIIKYTPPTNWDIANLSLTSSHGFFNPYSEVVRSITFSNDGTSLIIGGSANAYIQYDLSSPWDLSNSSMRSGSSYEISSIDKYFFTDDGLSMYTIELTRTIRQYSLNTPYDIKDLTLVASFTLPIATFSSPQDLYIKPDGTQLFVINSSGSTSRVYRYTLSTPWLISSATSLITFLSVASQERDPTSFTFKPDGTAMFVFGLDRKLYHYKFFVAWDQTSAVYQGVVLNFDGSGPLYFLPSNFALSQDGYNVFICSSNYQIIRKYVANTAWDYLTVPSDLNFYPSHAQQYSYLQNIARNSSKIAISTDSTKMVFSNGNILSVGTLSSANDLTTLTVQDTDGGISFKPMGIGHTHVNYDYSKLYTVSGNRLYEYTMNGSFSVASTSNTSTNVFISNSFSSFTMSNNNTDVYLCSNFLSSTIYRYKMSNASNLASIAFANVMSVSDTSYGVDSLSLKNDDTSLYVNAKNKLMMFDYALTANPSNTRIDITTSYVGQKLMTGVYLDYPIGLYFKPDGTKLYIGDYKDGTLISYNLPTPWDIQTATFSNALTLSSSTLGKLYITRDGTTIYHIEASPRIVKTVFSSPWNFSAGTQVSSTLLTDYPFNNVVFSNDGSKAYASNTTSVVEYSLSTPWDLTSKTLAYTLSGNFSDTLVIPPSGNAIYVPYQYQIKKIPLTTNWSLATNQTPIVYTQSQANTIVGLAFDTGGNNMITLDFDRSTLFNYSIG